MAVINTCAKLNTGLDLSCQAPNGKYFQQAVIINKVDIETITYTPPVPPSTCAYTVHFELKPGTTGYRVAGIEAGSSFFGSFDKTRSDAGYPQYTHNVQILVGGVSEEVKCFLSSLDKGSYVVAMQFTDGTVEIYGLANGMSTGDYTYDVQGGNGTSLIVLSSLDTSPENFLPQIYVSSPEGTETADFDSAFAQPEVLNEAQKQALLLDAEGFTGTMGK
jgi:hypothetical protein